MTRKYLPALALLALAACSPTRPASTSRPTTAASTPGTPVPMRALIVGGGADPSQSQAGIESNARYVASLLQGARATKLLWNDGSKQTASVAEINASEREKYLLDLALAFALSEDWPEESIAFRKPKLPRLDGAASARNVAAQMNALGRSLQPDETALLYLTGHGSPGERADGSQDFADTVYWMWGERPLSVRALSPMVQSVPAQNPLVIVGVQCHAGGFANLMFQNGDPKKPTSTRDFCGFFAATADRQSSGCTPLVDEAGAEDFTTHFFAALSGLGRGGRSVGETDYDGDGRTSMLEAFAYAGLRDESIDVPTCTSQEWLRRAFPSRVGWALTPYSKIEAAGAPWQAAMLRGLSQRLKLSGERRLFEASFLARELQRRNDSEDAESAWPAPLVARGEALRLDLERRFPGLRRDISLAAFQKARRDAAKYLRTRPVAWRSFARDIEKESAKFEAQGVREAVAWRFVDACMALIAEQKLRSGPAAQRAAFARLRKSEARSLFEARRGSDGAQP